MLYEDLAGHCPKCGRESGFTQAESLRVWPRYVPSAALARMVANGPRIPGGALMGPAASPPEATVHVTVLVCLACHDTITLMDHIVGDKVAEREVLYPRPLPRDLDVSVPPLVRSAFREASVCESAGAMRGAAVMYRASVEEMLKDRGAAGRTLNDRISTLKGTPGVADELVDNLNEARLLGNTSIHDLLEYDAEEVADVAELIEEAALVLYEQPAKRSAMRGRRELRRGRPSAT